MNFKLLDKDLIDKLKKQNGVLEARSSRTMEIIKICETKRTSRTIYNARIKIDQESYNCNVTTFIKIK